MSAPRIAAISPAKQELLLRMLRARREAPQPPAAMTVEQMLAEAVLPADIDPAMAAPPSAAPATFLLTGATGFIGAYLLDALRTRNRAPIYCLVRAADAAEAKARLAANLAVYGLAPPDDNVVAAPGDLAAPRLGLDAAAFERLAGETDAILHCGALVKWTYPYAALRGANVEGTLEVLRLATRGRLKPVHFISTVGVFSSGEHRGGAVLETTPLEDSGSLAVGYAQSKWIAEKLVRLAGARGLPVAIYRPNTGPDSRSGAFNTSDYISQILRGCIALGAAPALDFPICGAAIDYAARAIVHLALAGADGRVFHLVDPVGTGWREIVDWTVRAGYALDTVDFAEWKRRLGAVPGGFALAPFFTEGNFERIVLPRFDTAQVVEGLRGTDIRCPLPRYEQFCLTLRHFARRGFLPPPGGAAQVIGSSAGK